MSKSSPLVPTYNPAAHLTHSFQKTANSHYNAGNGDGTLFPVAPSIQPCSEAFRTSGQEFSEAVLNTLPSNLESVNGLKLQPQSTNDLESAAQNAVLHEQVCCTLLIGALFLSSFLLIYICLPAQEIAAQKVIQSQRFVLIGFHLKFYEAKTILNKWMFYENFTSQIQRSKGCKRT